MSQNDPPSSKPSLPPAAKHFRRAGSIASKIPLPSFAAREPFPAWQGSPSSQDLKRLNKGDKVKFFREGRILDGVVVSGPKQTGRGISGVLYEIEVGPIAYLVAAVKLISYERKVGK